MNSFDKTFKDKLENYEAGFSDDLWSKIDNQLTETQNKQYIVKPLFLTIGSVAAIFVLFLYFTPTSFYKKNTHANDNVAVSSEIINTNIYYPKDSYSEFSTDNHKPEVESITQNTEFVQNKNKGINIKTTFTPRVENNVSFSNDSFEEMVFDEDIESTLLGETESSNRFISPFTNIKNLTSLRLTSDKSQNLEIANVFSKGSNNNDACAFVSEYSNKSLDLYYSNDYNNRSFTATNDNLGLRDIRLSTEKPVYSFSAGVRLGYNLGYRWNIHTGLNYSQINEKFQYTDPESNKVRIVITKDYVYDNGVVIDSIIRQEEVIVPGTTQNIVYNKIKSVDLPILLRFTIMANQNLSLSAMSGVYLNISSSERGMIISHDTAKPIDLADYAAEGYKVYKDQFGVSVYAGLSVAYHIDSNLDFLIEPHARIQTASITSDAYPLNQKYNSFGLSAGLRYKF